MSTSCKYLIALNVFSFCLFNNIAICAKYAIERYGIDRIAIIDIDAHHGDGVFYSFVKDPSVWIIDIHQLPLYPGTGYEWETGEGEAKGTKLNIPLKPYSGDKGLLNSLDKVLEFGERSNAEIVFLQAGADGRKRTDVFRVLVRPCRQHADNLHRLVCSQFHTAHCKFIGIGMLFTSEHFTNDHTLQSTFYRLHLFNSANLKTYIGKYFRKLFYGQIYVDITL